MIYRFSTPAASAPIHLFSKSESAPKLIFVRSKGELSFETVIDKTNNGA